MSNAAALVLGSTVNVIRIARDTGARVVESTTTIARVDAGDRLHTADGATWELHGFALDRLNHRIAGYPFLRIELA